MGIFKYFETTIIQFFFKNEVQTFNLHTSPINDILLLVIRVVSCIVLNLSLIWSQIRNPGATNFFTQLTYFGFFFTNAYFNCVAFDYIFNYRRKISGNQEVSPNLKYWTQIFGEIGLSSEMAITILYWIVLFPSALKNTPAEIAQSSNIHSFPVICLIIDFIFNSLTFNFRRIIIIVLFTLWYIAVNASYSLLYKPIYGPVTWKSVYSYVLIAVALGIIYLFFFVGSIIYCCIKSRFLPQEAKKQQNGNIPVQTV